MPFSLLSLFARAKSKLHLHDIGGLGATSALYDVEVDFLSLFQSLEAVRLNRREVSEHVIAILNRDKSVSLFRVKPFYCSCHDKILLKNDDDCDAKKIHTFLQIIYREEYTISKNM